MIIFKLVCSIWVLIGALLLAQFLCPFCSLSVHNWSGVAGIMFVLTIEVLY